MKRILVGLMILAGAAWGQITSMPVGQIVGSGAPGMNCLVGQNYFRTDAVAGSNKYLCTALNVWTQSGTATAGTVTGTGTTNALPKYTNGAAGVIGDSALADDGTQIYTTTRKVGIGTATPDRQFHVEVGDAVTNAVTYTQRNTHTSSGAAAAGFGSGSEVELENAAGANKVAAATEVSWETATDAAEVSNWTLKTMTAGALQTSGLITLSKTYWGLNAGQSNTGNNPTMVGLNAGQSNTGNNPTMVGRNAGQSNTGANPTMVGFQAGQSNTGTYPTMVGLQAGLDNTGTYPTMVGYTAGQSNTGAYPTMVGVQAGLDNTGTSPTMVGYAAGLDNTGTYPTMVGRNAGLSNTGTYPTMVGVYAGQSNTGAYPTMVGVQAGLDNTGTNPTMVGYAAGQSNTGNNPTMVGVQAGQSNTGTYPTMVGVNRGYQNNWDNVTALGARSATTFPENATTTKNITEANVTGANTITYVAHGFGTVGGKVNIIYKLTGGAAPVGLVHNTVYQFTVTSADVLTLAGIAAGPAAFTGTLTNSTDVHNSIAVGFDAVPTKAHQAVLGAADITETVLRGTIVNPNSNMPLWYKYSLIAIANGVNGCANANGCWQVNGVLGAIKTAGFTQDVVLAALPAKWQVSDWSVKTATVCTGATTALSGMGVTSNTTLFRAQTYDIMAAVADANLTTGPTAGAGANTAAGTNLIASLITTVANVDQLVVGCAVDFSVLWSVRP